jgi:hypothetical protein
MLLDEGETQSQPIGHVRSLLDRLTRSRETTKVEMGADLNDEIRMTGEETAGLM